VPGDALAGGGEEAGPSGQPQGSSKTDSLAVLLTQALRRCEERAGAEVFLSKNLSQPFAPAHTSLLHTLAPHKFLVVCHIQA
jgi:hypothetical protein